MSPRLVIILAIVWISAFGVGVTRWIVSHLQQPCPERVKRHRKLHPTPTAVLTEKSSLEVMLTATFAAARR